MSRNEQFNQQYEEMIDIVKSRAIWRVGEQIAEREAFHCHCFNCGYQSLHQRFDITRHRLVFGKSIRAIEAPRPMLHCRRCGHQQHLRDVGELVVPSTIELHDDLRDTMLAHLRTAPETGELPAEMVQGIARFRDEASTPVRQHLLASVSAGAAPPAAHEPAADSGPAPTPTATADDHVAAILEMIGRELFLSSDQIAAAIDRQFLPGTDEPIS